MKNIKNTAQNTNFYEFRDMLEKCKSEAQLLKIATQIDQTWKTNGLDEVDVDRLQEIGFNVYERINQRTKVMVRNRKV